MVSERVTMHLLRMKHIGEGNSTTRPHVLDGVNYAYWKARMIAFLQVVNMNA